MWADDINSAANIKLIGVLATVTALEWCGTTSVNMSLWKRTSNVKINIKAVYPGFVNLPNLG